MSKVENLIRKYGNFIAVDDISFETSCTITIDGKDIADHRQQVQSGIGYLPERAEIVDNFMSFKRLG